MFTPMHALCSLTHFDQKNPFTFHITVAVVRLPDVWKSLGSSARWGEDGGRGGATDPLRRSDRRKS